MDDLIIYNDTTQTVIIEDLGIEIDPGEGADISGLPSEEIDISNDLQVYFDDGSIVAEKNGTPVTQTIFYASVRKDELNVSTPQGAFKIYLSNNDTLTFNGNLISISADINNKAVMLEPNLSSNWDFSNGTLILPNSTSEPIGPSAYQIFINTNDNRAYMYDGSNWHDLIYFTNFINEHETLATLKHKLSEDAFYEINRDANNFVTSIIAYTDSSKTTKIREITISRDTSNLVNTITYNQYDSSGTLIQSEIRSASRDANKKIISIQSTFEENRNGL